MNYFSGLLQELSTCIVLCDTIVSTVKSLSLLRNFFDSPHFKSLIYQTLLNAYYLIGIFLTLHNISLKKARNIIHTYVFIFHSLKEAN